MQSIGAGRAWLRQRQHRSRFVEQPDPAAPASLPSPAGAGDDAPFGQVPSVHIQPVRHPSSSLGAQPHRLHGGQHVVHANKALQRTLGCFSKRLEWNRAPEIEIAAARSAQRLQTGARLDAGPKFVGEDPHVEASRTGDRHDRPAPVPGLK